MRIWIGDGETRYNSVWVHEGPVDLTERPWLDMTLRTDADEALAILFQIQGDTSWYALDLVANHELFPSVDRVPAETFSDGRWRRVTWEMHRAIRDEMEVPAPVIHNVVLGCWQRPSEEPLVEIKSLAFGMQRTLD